MKVSRRNMLAAGAARLVLPATAILPAAAQEKTARISVAIPAATHGRTGDLDFHTERTIQLMQVTR